MDADDFAPWRPLSVVDRVAARGQLVRLPLAAEDSLELSTMGPVSKDATGDPFSASRNQTTRRVLWSFQAVASNGGSHLSFPENALWSSHVETTARPAPACRREAARGGPAGLRSRPSLPGRGCARSPAGSGCARPPGCPSRRRTNTNRRRARWRRPSCGGGGQAEAGARVRDLAGEHLRGQGAALGVEAAERGSSVGRGHGTVVGQGDRL